MEHHWASGLEWPIVDNNHWLNVMFMLLMFVVSMNENDKGWKLTMYAYHGWGHAGIECKWRYLYDAFIEIYE